MRVICGIIVLVMVCLVSLPILASGAQEYWVFLRNPVPAEISLDEYLKCPVKPEWVHLSHCDVDDANAVSLPDLLTHKFNETAIPIYADGNREAVPIVLVHRGNVDSTRGAGRQSVQGLVRQSITLNSRRLPMIGLDLRLRSAARWNLGRNYIIVDEGYEPNSTKASTKVGVGVLLCLLSIWGIVSILNRPKKPNRKEYAASMQLSYGEK